MNQIQKIVQSEWFPYVSPFVVFLVLTYIGAQFPGLAHIWYAAKTLVVGTMLFVFRRRYPELRWSRTPVEWMLGICCGIVVLVVWVAPEKLLAPLMMGEPGGFDPGSFGLSESARWSVVAIRIFGASVVVPVMEELFWRSFLMRYFVSSNFRQVALGTFRAVSFVLIAIAFGLEHHRWLVGILAGVLYGGLLVWRRDLFSCVLAHGVTNLGLGLYVVRTGHWTFW
jgi:CAAX protease family protein